MKRIEEIESKDQESVFTEEEIEDKSEVYDEDTELKKELVSRFLNKTELLDKTVIMTLLGLGKNKFGKKTLIVDIDGEERSININATNVNELIDLFGSKLKDWKGQKVKVTGKEYRADNPDYKDGVVLSFKRV